MAGETLGELLQQFSLEKYYETFASVGIHHTAHLLALTMQDYPTLGINSMQDRRKMFHLIQNIKDKENLTARPSISRGYQFTKKKDKEISKSESHHDKGQLQTGMQTPVQPKTTPLRSQNVTTPNMHNFSYGIPSSKFKPSISKSKIMNESSNIKVCVRKRPLGNDELESGEEDVVNVEVDGSEVVINAPKVAVDLTKYMQKFSFVFDEVFDESFSNHQIYEKTAKPLVNAIFAEGAKATCFAYGCTGSGKTYTMLGTDNVPGLYLLAASDIFNILYSGNHGNDLGLWVSFYEIYCGQLFDLLNDRSKLFARENASHQVCIVGLTERQVNNVEELMEVIESGGNSRSTGSTGVNADSSRSHAVLQLDLKQQQEGESLGRFSFIDLAGSERAADVTDSDKQTRMEGAEINQSLLALKECIRSLDQDSRHTPFRQSKLTQVLKDSFVGNTRTCMIANVSPCQSSCENTLNTLRYADRVKELNKNVPDPLSPRPVTVHGNIGKDTGTSHMTRITNSSVKNKALDKTSTSKKMSLNLNNVVVPESQQTRNQSPIKTPRINTKTRGFGNDNTVLKSLQIPPNTPRQSSLLSRPETSPAVIKEVTYKPRSRSRLQYLNKEQSYNMLQTNQKYSSKEKYSKDGIAAQKSIVTETKDTDTCEPVLSKDRSTAPVTKARRQKPQTRNSQSSQCDSHVEKLEERMEAQNVRFSSNKRRNVRANKLEVLPKENRIEEVQERPLTPKLRSTDKRKSNSEQQLVQNIKTQNNKVTRTVAEDKPANNQKINILKLDTEREYLLNMQARSNTIPDRQDRTQPEEKVCKEQKPELRINKSLKTSPDAPQSNHRYSKGIKARLAQLFTSKTAGNPDVLPDHKDTLTSSSSARAPLQRGLTESMTHRVISEEQIVAAHHTQLAMITGLCHEEMVLLKQRDKNNQDFLEYVAQVEEILIQKQTCIQNLQDKLGNWKASLQHIEK